MGVTVQTPQQIEELVRLEACDAFNIGGTYGQIIACARAAANARRPVWIGSGCETGLSDLAAVHLGCTLGNCTVGSDLVGNLYRQDDLLVRPLEFVKGRVQVPEGPGRGIATDLDAIERYRVADPIVVE